MKKELIKRVMDSNRRSSFMIRTNLPAGRGINGTDYRCFNTQRYIVSLEEEYISFSRNGQLFLTEYEHIESIELFDGRYDYSCGGIE